MAATGLTRSAVSTWLADKWLPQRRKTQFNRRTVLLDEVRRDMKPIVVNNQYIIPAHTGRNWGTGARAGEQTTTTGFMPTPGSQDRSRFVFDICSYYGAFKITGLAKDVAKNNGNGLSDLKKFEGDNVPKDMSSDMNRDLYGDGTGSLATCSNGGSSTTVTISAYIQYLKPNQPIVITNGTTYYEETVQTVNTSAGTITIGNARDLSTPTWKAYPPGLANVSSATAGTSAYKDRALTGLQAALADNNTYGGVDRTAVAGAWARSNVRAGIIDFDFFQEFVDQIETTGDGNVDFIGVNHIQWRKIGNLMWPNVVWEGNKTTTLKGGFQAIEWNGIKIVKDKDCPVDQAMFLDSSTLIIPVTCDLDFMGADEDGLQARMVEGSSAADEWTWRLKWRGQLVCDAPAKCGRLTGLSL